MPDIAMRVNGKAVQAPADARMHLGDFLRETLQLTGTNLSCEHGVCGACTVLMDGQPIRACISFAVACADRHITTIEGYEDDPIMQRLRQAFTQHHALQCGFCTPGMLTTARDIVLRLPDADEKRVRIELAGNICRCTGYQGITAAILSVLADVRATPDPAVATLRTAMAAGKGATPLRQAESFTAFTATPQQDAIPASALETKPSTHKTNTVSQGTRVASGFHVPFPPDMVWVFMTDLERVAACLPGAVIEHNDGQNVQGRIAVKFGPMSAAFKGSAHLSLDADNLSAVLHGSGQDSASQSRAKGDVHYHIVAAQDGKHAQIEVELHYALQGPLAQFSRSGLVQDFVKRMISDFGRNVAHRLTHPGEDHPIPQAKLNPLRLFLQVLWDRCKRLFGKP